MIIDRLFRAGSLLLIGSLIVVYWIIIADRLSGQRQEYGPPSVSELGREVARHDVHILNLEGVVGNLNSDISSLKTLTTGLVKNQDAMIATQKETNSRLDYFLFALIGLGAKALFDLWHMVMERHK